MINKSDKDILLNPHDHKRRSDWIAIFNFLDRNLDYSKINKAADLGAGLGDISYHILRNNDKSENICIDNDISSLKIAAERHYNIKTLAYDINKNLPIEDGAMDMVSCLGTLHYFYINSPEKVLEEIVRISKKYILIDFFYKYRPWHFLLKIKYPNYNPRRYSAKQIKQLITKYNLKIIGSVGTRNLFGKLLPSFGRTTLFLLEKK